jgi:hypothetical protein
VRVTPERRKEGSFNLIPGAVRIVPPVSAISPRLLRPPRAPRAPQALPARPRLRAIRGGVI